MECVGLHMNQQFDFLFFLKHTLYIVFDFFYGNACPTQAREWRQNRLLLAKCVGRYKHNRRNFVVLANFGFNLITFTATTQFTHSHFISFINFFFFHFRRQAYEKKKINNKWLPFMACGKLWGKTVCPQMLIKLKTEKWL